MQHYCTYFDRGYAARSLCLLDSLREHHSDDFVLWALCLDDETYTGLQGLSGEQLKPLSLQTLLDWDPQLAHAQQDRSQVEFYFTCTPCLALALLNEHPEIDAISYLDADLYFFSDPMQVCEAMHGADIGLTPHRFSPHLKRKYSQYGKYNVGLVYFRNTDQGRSALAWWRQACLDWCHDYVDGARYADQGYLSELPHRFDSVRDLGDPGFNLAPWNVAQHCLSATAQGIRVDRSNLVFYHFQGIRRLRENRFDLNLAGYRTRSDACLRDRIYHTYLLALIRAEHRLSDLAPETFNSRSIRTPKPWRWEGATEFVRVVGNALLRRFYRSELTVGNFDQG